MGAIVVGGEIPETAGGGNPGFGASLWMAREQLGPMKCVRGREEISFPESRG